MITLQTYLKLSEAQELDEGFKSAIAAGIFAVTALLGGTVHAQSADLSHFNTNYLEAVVKGEVSRPIVNLNDAKKELEQRENGKKQTVSKTEAPATVGFSKEYLEKAADPNRFGRFLLSVDQAKKLLAEM